MLRSIVTAFSLTALAVGVPTVPVGAQSVSPSGHVRRHVTSDFNGDGYSDLAIGVLGIRDNVAGSVDVLYGSNAGLRAAGSQSWSFDSPGIRGTSHGRDEFGAALAAGDFNGDGRADLAIGVPDHRIDAQHPSWFGGAVVVLYGSTDRGLVATGSQVWTLASPGIPGDPTRRSEFGGSLAAGDFDGDGRDDLAIGPATDFDDHDQHQQYVDVIYGSSTGLRAVRAQRWAPGQGGLPKATRYAGFGADLAVGDFDGDRKEDLAVGEPWDSIDYVSDAGAVVVLYGSAHGLTAAGSQRWSQASPGVRGTPGEIDEFGAALASGDFNGDGSGDLAVGIVWKVLPSSHGKDAGAVEVLYGSSTGLKAAGSQLWGPGSPGVPGTPDDSDLFGLSLASGDFNRDGRADVAVGAVNDLTSNGRTGSVTVLDGGRAGLTANGSRLWTQASAGIPGRAESGDEFGWSLATGDYRGNGRTDLAIGVPYEGYGRTPLAGAVNVIYAAAGGLTGSGAQLWDSATAGVPGAPQSYVELGWSLTNPFGSQPSIHYEP